MGKGSFKLFCMGASLIMLAVAVTVSATAFTDSLKVSLLEVGGLWIRACQDLLSAIKSVIVSIPDFSSPWTYAGLVLGSVVIYYLVWFLFFPMNRVRQLGDLGYVPEGKFSMKQVANMVQKRRAAGETPPVFPNGWFGVLESRDLPVGGVTNVSCLGLNLVVFRGEDGRAHILDAYCPHLGANLAVGGRVFGNCIECPFHGWKFRGDDGKCMHIPSAEKVPDLARTKSYLVCELNGFIHMWFHAEGLEPYWMPPELEEITSGEWQYRGRTEHFVNCHIQEIPENGSDLAHLPQVHGCFMFSGTDLRFMYNKVWDFGKHEWHGEWTPDPAPNSHIGSLRLTHSLKLFGIHCSFLDMSVLATQIGPGIVYLTWECIFGRGAFLHYVLPNEALLQRVTHQVYMNRWVPPFIAKFFLVSEALQIERDIMIWNNKTYVKKPIFCKTKEDQLLVKHRRWYSQFYSENSPKLTFRKDTLDW